MKTRASYLLIIFGAIGLIGQMSYRVHRERNILEAQMQAQQASLVEGLKSAWKDRLLQAARAEKLEHSFQLRWNRQGSELRDVFFPMKKANMDWDRYRHFVQKSEAAAAEQFLQKALERENSWDRVLAITEWQTRYRMEPEAKTEYERTWPCCMNRWAAKPPADSATADLENSRSGHHIEDFAFDIGLSDLIGNPS